MIYKERSCHSSGYTILLSILFLVWANLQGTVARASAEQYLGTGLLVIYEPLQSTYSFPLYKDSACRQLLMQVTPEQTTCPVSMLAAEPEAHHSGPVDPFICGGGMGLQFIYTRSTARFSEIYIDTNYTKAYVKPGTGKYYTWDRYFRDRAAMGDYFEFDRSYDSNILYKRPYPEDALPPAGKTLQVGTHFKDLSDLRFYPVRVQGYWMQLRAVRDKRTMGYCWVIWRSDKAWLIGFKFRTN